MSISIGQIIKSYPGMERVEGRIKEKFHSEVPILTKIPEYLFELGGKRIRPALALLVARMCGMAHPSEALIDVSAGIELIHMATLLHDDIIDQSPIRRGKESPHLTFGEPATLLSGDFLLVRAFSLCARLDDFIVQETEEACVYLTEGEMLEIPSPQGEKSPFVLEHSLEIAKKKTAALFGLAAVSGAHVAGVPDEIANQLKSFGIELGIAFQILDDVLDVIGEEEVLGKKPGGDLVEQKPSVVNVLWLLSGSALAKELLTTPHPPSPDQVGRALHELQAGEGETAVAKARELAFTKIAAARAELERAKAGLLERALPFHSESHQTLQALIEYTVQRLQ